VKGGTLRRFAINSDCAPMGLDNALGHGQPQSGSLTRIFGGEVGVKNPLHYLRGYTVSCVTDRQSKIRTGI